MFLYIQGCRVGSRLRERALGTLRDRIVVEAGAKVNGLLSKLRGVRGNRVHFSLSRIFRYAVVVNHFLAEALIVLKEKEETINKQTHVCKLPRKHQHGQPLLMVFRRVDGPNAVPGAVELVP